MHKKVRQLLANGFALFLDFSLGATAASLVGWLVDCPVTAFHLITSGMLGVSPDLDVFYPIVRGKDPAQHHYENWTHFPLLSLPIVFTVGFWAGGIFWGGTALLAFLGHYLHDTEGLGGGGMAWFWPFSQKYYSPLPPWKGKDRFESFESQWTGKHYEWFEMTWMRSSALSVTELSVGTLLFATALSSVFGLWVAAWLLGGFWVLVAYVWLGRFR